MELCQKCKKMSAEKNHYTGEIICYNRFCDQEAKDMRITAEKISPNLLALAKKRDEEVLALK